MKSYTKFSELKEILQNTYILQYLEFDDNNSCYFVLDHAIPFFNNFEEDTQIILADAKDGTPVHSFKKEKDFLEFVIEDNSSLNEITVLHKSNYYYKIFFKKL